mmetsp:Transcript_33879/g.90363  ORF Transcript_33879/g.90363 Transcript_33879/m.90363 type:complete len:236 (-) Transcript_33879:198-905(-)
MPPCAGERDLPRCLEDGTVPVLLATAPEPPEVATILPGEDPEAFLLILSILAPEGSSVRPRVPPASVDQGIPPLSSELTTICASVHSMAVERTVHPRTEVLRTVGPPEGTESLLLSPDVLPVVDGSALPLFHSMTVLQIILPLATVGGESSPMVVHAITLRCTPYPLTDEKVTIGMQELASALGKIVHPLANVGGAVNPRLFAHAMPRVSAPLAQISCTRREGVERPRTVWTSFK